MPGLPDVVASKIVNMLYNISSVRTDQVSLWYTKKNRYIKTNGVEEGKGVKKEEKKRRASEKEEK